MNRYLPLALLAALALAGCATHEVPNCCARRIGPAQLTLPPKPEEDVAELQRLKPGRAARNEDDLILILANGSSLALENDISGCFKGPEHCDGYRLMADLPVAHVYVVSEYAFDSEAYLLIDDRSGQRTRIGALPVFAPDGARFLIQDNSVAANHLNNLEIWRRDGDRAVLEWSHSLKEAALELPGIAREPYRTKVIRWDGNRIDLTFSVPETLDPANSKTIPSKSWAGRITGQNGGWLLTADWPRRNAKP